MPHLFLTLLTLSVVIDGRWILPEKRQLADRIVLPDVLNQLLELSKPHLEKEARAKFPGSYGSCTANPPQPCQEQGALYSEKKTWYKVLVRWIGGLNDLEIKSMSLAPIEVNSTELEFNMQLLFHNLPMSIKLDGCAPVVGCTNLFDNRDSCCGDDKVVSLKVKLNCHEDKPFLRDIKVKDVNISPKLEVKASAFGKFDIKLKDITDDVEKQLEETAATYLEVEAIEGLNSVINSLAGDSVYCKDPPPTPAPTKKGTATPSSPSSPPPAKTTDGQNTDDGQISIGGININSSPETRSVSFIISFLVFLVALINF